MTGTHLEYLTAFLNSKLFRFTFKEYFPELLGDSREISKIYFEKVTIKAISEELNLTFGNLLSNIEELKSQGKSSANVEDQVELLISEIYNLNEEEKELVFA